MNFRRRRTAPSVDGGVAPSRPRADGSASALQGEGVENSGGPWRVLRAVVSVVTPVTLITALMYYFGLIHAYWFFGGFGVDYSVFDLTPEDYILRSADGLFLPFCVVAVVVLVLTSVFQLVGPRLDPTFIDRFVRGAAPVLLVLGVGLSVVAGVAIARPYWLLNYPAVGGLALVFGVLSFTGGIRSVRWLAKRRGRVQRRLPTSWAVAEWASVVMLVSVGLFWAVGDFSARVGSQRAEEVVRALPSWPALVLHSERRLDLAIPGVIETVCAGDDGTASYRYDGLTLITQEGGQLLLLPRSWTAAKGSAIVLAKTDALLLQFSATAAANSSGC